MWIDVFEVMALIRMNCVCCKIMEIGFGLDWELEL